MVKIEIDKKRCIGCGTCVRVCPAKVYKIIDGKAHPVNPEACLVCRACVIQCPVGCISLGPREYEPLKRLYG